MTESPPSSPAPRQAIDLTPPVNTRAPERSVPNSHGWTRADLMALIARCVRAGITYSDDGQAMAVADMVLRRFGAARLKISSMAPIDRRQPGEPRHKNGQV